MSVLEAQAFILGFPSRIDCKEDIFQPFATAITCFNDLKHNENRSAAGSAFANSAYTDYRQQRRSYADNRENKKHNDGSRKDLAIKVYRDLEARVQESKFPEADEALKRFKEFYKTDLRDLLPSSDTNRRPQHNSARTLRPRGHK